MAQPPAYTPVHSFVTDSATLANFPGQNLDVEFADIKITTDAIRVNLALIQRDDGALANGTVGYDQLSATLQTAGIAPATAWLTATAYVVGNSVAINGSLYRCLVAHTSGTFATDLAAGKWLFIATFISDATLVALSNLDATAGFLVETAADTFTKRTLTGTANQITISDGDGVAAAPVFSLPSVLTLPGTINKLTLTAPVTSATLTLIDGTVLTGPAASGTAMTLGNAETVTGAKTFGSAGAVGKLKVAGTTSGSTILDATAVASGTLTLPAATDTLVGKATTDILTNKTFGAIAIGNSGAELDFNSSLITGYAVSFQSYAAGATPAGTNLVVGLAGSTANLNQITLNSGNTGTGTGAFLQHDVNGLLNWAVGSRSGMFNVAYDATPVFVSQNGWKWLTGAALGATPLFTAGSIRIASDGTISSASNATQAANLGVGMMVSSFATVNFNSANTDNALTITLPTGYTRYQILRIQISGASASLTTSTFGVFSATAAGGTAVVASGTANTVSATAENTANNSQSLTVAVGASGGTTSINFATLYFRVQTAQGSAATGNVTVLYHVMV